jgi:hypothetical protein
VAVSAEHAADANSDGDIHAAADHRLLRFRATLGVEDIEREPVPFEDAGLLPELRNPRVPGAALRHRDLEQLLGRGPVGAGTQAGEVRQCRDRHDNQCGSQYGLQYGLQYRLHGSFSRSPSSPGTTGFSLIGPDLAEPLGPRS